jgi:hypothetical protein
MLRCGSTNESHQFRPSLQKSSLVPLQAQLGAELVKSPSMADKAETATALMTALHDTFLEGPALHFSADAKQRAANSMFGTTKFSNASSLITND